MTSYARGICEILKECSWSGQNIHKSWDKFIWRGYPNEESWEKHRQAKQEGIIEEHDKIVGEIGIHGVPEGTDEIFEVGMNWTLGCILLKTKTLMIFIT